VLLHTQTTFILCKKIFLETLNPDQHPHTKINP
jgi:hypothetical protein